MTPLYDLRAIRHRYGPRTVLNLDGLAIERGEVLGLVGPSGAGKSTLLRLLNFLEPPSEGALVFDGRSINPHAPLDVRRRVTTVFQRPALLDRTVNDNVRFGLALRGKPADGRVDQALAQVGLTDLARTSARKLSGGELQRAALARALVLQPDVLLLDEPTANLDPYNVGLIEDIVRRENRERGTTIVLVTHNIFQARRLAHRVGLLWEGRLLELAPTHDFFETPRVPQVAAFLRGDLVY